MTIANFVIDFGAVGDGSTNNDAAIAAAMASSASAIYVPAGDYVYTATLTIDNDKLWYGDGAYLNTGAPSSTLKYTGTGDAVSFRVARMRDIYIEGTAAATNGIALGGGVNIAVGELTNVGVHGFTQSGAAGICANKCVGVIMNRLYVPGNYRAFYTPNGSSNTTIKAYDCQWRNSIAEGMRLTNAMGFEFHSNVWEANGQEGLVAYGAGVDGVNLFGGWFEANHQTSGVYQAVLSGSSSSDRCNAINMYGVRFAEPSAELLVDFTKNVNIDHPWTVGMSPSYLNITANALNSKVTPYGASAGNTSLFLAYNSVQRNNVTGDNTHYPVPFDTKIIDLGNNYNASTGVYTAQYTGPHKFTVAVMMNGLSAAHTEGQIFLITTQYTHQVAVSNFGTMRDGSGNLTFHEVIEAPMNAGDTAFVRLDIYNGSKTVNVLNGPGATIFSGELDTGN